MAETVSARRGIAWMLTAMACYVLNDAIVKLTLPVFPAGQVLTVRGLAAGLVVVVVARPAVAQLRQALAHPLMLLRCGLEIATAVTSMLALARVPLSVASALTMTAPLLIAAVSMGLRWEPPRPRRLLAVAAGFVGALLVLRPSTPASGFGVILACLCAVSLAARDIATQRLPAATSSSVVAVLTTLALVAAGPVLGVTLHEHWQPLLRRETIALLGAAAFSAAGNYALIVACRSTELALVTPFRYSIILWACLLGYLLWGEIPDRSAMIGILTITGAGIVNLRTTAKR